MHSRWELTLNTTTEAKAQKLLQRIKDTLDCELLEVYLEPHSFKEKKFMLSFQVEHDTSDWRNLIYEVLVLGERLGYHWQIMGSVIDNPDGYSTKTTIAGIEEVHWYISRSQ